MAEIRHVKVIPMGDEGEAGVGVLSHRRGLVQEDSGDPAI